MPLIYSPTQKVRKTVAHSVFLIPYFSAHCISDHLISKPNPNPNPDNSPDHDWSHLLVRDTLVRNAVGRKGVTGLFIYLYAENVVWIIFGYGCYTILISSKIFLSVANIKNFCDNHASLVIKYYISIKSIILVLLNMLMTFLYYIYRI